MSAESSSAQAVIARQQLLNPDQSNLKAIKDGYYARRWAMHYLHALFGVSEQKYWTECGLVEVAQAEIEAAKERPEVTNISTQSMLMKTRTRKLHRLDLKTIPKLWAHLRVLESPFCTSY